LIQILTNLFSNAVKFTDEGTVKLSVANFLEFCVSDTGIGIPQEYQQRIFDRFYQVKYSVSRLYEGTGLGLAISKANVELMGGKIWLTSEAIRAHNGKEAVEKFMSDKNIDLILMDIKMPVMDGYTVVKLIREINSAIPIIAQTAYIEDREMAIESGFSGYISKPFNKKQLLDAFRSVLTDAVH